MSGDEERDYEDMTPVYATLHFYYDDPDSMRRMRECMDAPKVKAALWSFDQNLRNRWKYGDEDKQTMSIEEVRDLLYCILGDHFVDLDD